MEDMKSTLTYNRKKCVYWEYQTFIKVGGIQRVRCGTELISKTALVGKVMYLER
jgi:hypothetical protein